MGKHRFAIGMLFFLCGINFASWATRIPDYKASLQLNDADLGTILMALPIGSLVSLPIAGWLLTIYRSHYICLIGVAMYLLVFPFLAMADSRLALFVGLFLFGMAGDVLNIAMNTQVVRLEQLFQKVLMSSFHAIFSIGLMMGAFFGGLLIKWQWSPSQHFYVLTLINGLSIFAFYPFLINEAPSVPEGKKEKSALFSLSPYLIILSAIAFGGMLCEGAMADWLTLYFKESQVSQDWPPTLGFSAFALAMVIGRMFGDFLSQRFGMVNLLICCGLLIFIGMLIALQWNQIYWMTLGCFLSGLGIATIVPLVYRAAGNAPDIAPSLAIAGVSTIAYIGFLIGPVLIGYLSDWSSLGQALYLLAFLGLAIALISFLSLSKQKKVI